jgi:REP element-mobilizing transposase RayT
VTFNPDIHHRHSIRLREYDYAQNGAYFVTVCTFQRECLFGEVGAGSKPAREWGMHTNEVGKLVEMTWHDLPNHNRNIVLDAFVVMPNHVHGILVIDGVGAGLELRAGLEPAPTLSELVRQFKTFSARRINRLRDNPCCPVWQRNYYERVIRNEQELARARGYIANNPLKWALDKENPANLT